MTCKSLNLRGNIQIRVTYRANFGHVDIVLRKTTENVQHASLLGHHTYVPSKIMAYCISGEKLSKLHRE